MTLNFNKVKNILNMIISTKFQLNSLAWGHNDRLLRPLNKSTIDGWCSLLGPRATYFGTGDQVPGPYTAPN